MNPEVTATAALMIVTRSFHVALYIYMFVKNQTSSCDKNIQNKDREPIPLYVYRPKAISLHINGTS
jgi:hypothetical protein